MKYICGLLMAMAVSFTVNASEIAPECAALQNQLEMLGSGGEQKMREMGMGQIIDMCAKEDTSEYKKKMKSGTLYCRSGSLCGKYDFQYESDRNKYLSGCAQVARCPSNYSDKCSLENDKVRGGRGTVNWTIYAYNGLVRDSAANLKCH